MLVATTTAPLRPAWATIMASFSWFFAFSTWCGTPRRLSLPESSSDFSIETVPTRIGCPSSWRSTMSSRSAFHLASSFLKIWS